MFQKIAGQFKKPSGLLGSLISSLMIRGNKSAYKTLVGDMKITPKDKLLEIGYGPGTGIYGIIKNYNPDFAYGIDFSPLMFKRASRVNKKYIKNNKLKLLFGDFFDTPIGASDFDKIFCLNVVYFWTSLKEPFEKIRLLLKDEGSFNFYMASKDDLDKLKFTDDDVFNKYSIEQVEEALKLAGFSDVKYYYKLGYFVEARK